MSAQPRLQLSPVSKNFVRINSDGLLAIDSAVKYKNSLPNQVVDICHILRTKPQGKNEVIEDLRCLGCCC